MPDSINWADVEKKFSELYDSLLPEIKPLNKGDKDILPYLSRTYNNMNDFVNLSQEILPTIKTPKDISILILINIFYLVEGILTFMINGIIYYLIQGHHHDIWDQIRQKFATNYDDVSTIPLSVKIKFLEKHGLKFIDKLIYRDIRNAFAHNNYTIDDDGKMTIFKKQKKVGELTLEELREVLTNIKKLLGANIRAYISHLDVTFEEFSEIMGNISLEDFMELANKAMESK